MRSSERRRDQYSMNHARVPLPARSLVESHILRIGGYAWGWSKRPFTSARNTCYRALSERHPRLTCQQSAARLVWSGRADLNRGPPAPKAGALPGCATPRLHLIVAAPVVLSLYSSSGRGARATSNSARDSVDPERRVKGAASPKSMRRIRGAAVGEPG